MKFTEEQYQKIIKIVNVYPDFGKEYIVPNGGEGEWSTTIKELITGIFGSHYAAEESLLSIQQMLALANPLTREWAHDKFVEKGKKYYWTGNKVDNVGLIKRLYKDNEGMIVDHGIREEDTDKAEDEQLTESEIKAWGYNPEMFDREEVK